MKKAKVLNSPVRIESIDFKLWLLRLARGQVLVFSFAFLVFTVLGCNESLQATTDYSGTSFAGNLMPEAVRIIREGLDDDNPRARANAIEVVAATKRIELMPKVQQLLKDEFVPVRFVAALAVGDMEYSLAEGTVKELLKDGDENVRIAAAYALAKLSGKKNFGIIRKATTNSDQTVRANAALLIGKSGDKDALGILYHLRDKDPDDKVRFLAVEALSTLGDERIYPKLWAMLISAYADDRVMGIRAMGALGIAKAKSGVLTTLDKDIKGAITTKLNDDVLEVRLAAAEQLGMLGYSIGEPEVLDVFTKKLTAGLDKKDLERVKVLTALAIGQIGTAPLMEFLPQLLKDKSQIVRIAAAKAVFQCQTAK